MVYLEQREKVDVRPEKRLVYLERMGFHGPVKSFVFKCIGKSIKKPFINIYGGKFHGFTEKK